MSVYKGESPGKKLARMKHWQAVMCGVCVPEGMPGAWTTGLLQDFTECPELQVLVLASSEGGDIAVMKALGVRPSQIVACDIDSEPRRRLVAARPPGCPVRRRGLWPAVGENLPGLDAGCPEFRRANWSG